jgi:hypothetical protein
MGTATLTTVLKFLVASAARKLKKRKPILSFLKYLWTSQAFESLPIPAVDRFAVVDGIGSDSPLGPSSHPTHHVPD